LLRFMHDEVNWPAMQQAARQSTIPYSPKNVAQEMLAGFRSVLARKHS